MLSTEEIGKIKEQLKEAELKLFGNAQVSLQLSRDRAADTGRDSLDQSTSEEMLSTDLRLRDREKKLLSKIQSAVARLKDGTIDQCEDCGESIGFKRLMARPVTTLCIDCKERREEQERFETVAREEERELEDSAQED
jgi:DnaK suppressor protein